MFFIIYILLLLNFLTEQVKWGTMLPINIPLIALVALDDDVRLGILPKSVDLVCFNRKMVACRTTEFKFCRGEVFCMHPAFVHYGCAYEAHDRSLRAHFYFDNPTIQRSKQGQHTYLFQEEVQPMPLNQCIAVRKKKQADTMAAIEEQLVTRKRTSKRASKEEASVEEPGMLISSGDVVLQPKRRRHLNQQEDEGQRGNAEHEKSQRCERQGNHYNLRGKTHHHFSELLQSEHDQQVKQRHGQQALRPEKQGGRRAARV